MIGSRDAFFLNESLSQNKANVLADPGYVSGASVPIWRFLPATGNIDAIYLHEPVMAPVSIFNTGRCYHLRCGAITPDQIARSGTPWGSAYWLGSDGTNRGCNGAELSSRGLGSALCPAYFWCFVFLRGLGNTDDCVRLIGFDGGMGLG